MAATSRKTRTYKEKSSMLAFGNFALPLAALVALGMLFIGIKLFFLTPPDRGGTDVAARPPVAQKAAELPPGILDELTAIVAEVPSISAPVVVVEPDQNSGTTVLAGPLDPRSTGGNQSTSRAPQSSTSAGRPASQTSEQRPAANTGPQNSTAAAANAVWGVQIGAFVNSEGASALADEVRKSGHSVMISTATASGKTYHRVRVAAGNNRGDADKLASELEKKGYPVLVVSMK